MRALAALSFFLPLVSLVLLAPHPVAAAPRCGEAASLAELVARSDAIALARISFRHLSVEPRGVLNWNSDRVVQVQAIDMTFERFLKRPYVEGFAKDTQQRVVHPPREVRLNQGNRALVFLRYRGENLWIAHDCGVLLIDERGTVEGACDAVEDLFGHDRFLRERRCLLAYPATVSLAEFERELERYKVHAHRYEGPAEIVQVSSWDPKQPFQRVVAKVRGSALKKLFPFSFRGSDVALTAYVPTETLDERKYRQRFRKGRRQNISGVWFEGNFVLD